jgi:hypothetical protein
MKVWLLSMLAIPWVSARAIDTENLIEPDDIYLIFYLSQNGRTGHIGIAIDNYRIVVRDIITDGKEITEYDSVKNYTLTYFDLWGPPEIRVDQHSENLACRYYKLPRTSAEPDITLRYFLSKGLPHAYDYPCDGLLRIHTTPAQDMEMIRIAEEIQLQYPYFNTRHYNCVDYVIQCLNTLFGIQIEAKEYIPFSWSSTPNKLYSSIGEYFDVEVLKDAGNEVSKSFVSERIFHSLFYNQTGKHEEID